LDKKFRVIPWASFLCYEIDEYRRFLVGLVD